MCRNMKLVNAKTQCIYPANEPAKQRALLFALPPMSPFTNLESNR